MVFLNRYVYFFSTFLLVILFLGACMNKKASDSNGTVIILNGPSSVGKTSIIKAFQDKQKTPWLGTGIDHLYVGVIPPAWLDDKPKHQSIMTVIKSEDKDGPIVKAVFGPEGEKVIKGMHRAIAAYAHSGNNVIVDYIKYEPEWIVDFKGSLSDVKVIFVGVNASLESIKQREKKRGTSPEGHARSHYDTVHQGIDYDLMIDTDSLTPEQSADKIIEFIKNKNSEK